MIYTSNTFSMNNYNIEEAEVVFLGIPFVSTSISKPALYGPLMVRESLKLIEGLTTKKICDIGNMEVVPGSFELTSNRIKETINDIRIQNKKAFPLFVGGDHSITLPIAEALKPRTILQFDAHEDMREEYLGNKYMQQTWALHASKFSKIFQIGINTECKEDKKVENVKKINPDEINNIIMERPLHLTIDIDVIENAATGFPEGKMSLEEVLNIINKIECDSMDIVEIADDRLPSNTGFAAAKIINCVLGK